MRKCELVDPFTFSIHNAEDSPPPVAKVELHSGPHLVGGADGSMDGGFAYTEHELDVEVLHRPFRFRPLQGEFTCVLVDVHDRRYFDPRFGAKRFRQRVDEIREPCTGALGFLKSAREQNLRLKTAHPFVPSLGAEKAELVAAGDDPAVAVMYEDVSGEIVECVIHASEVGSGLALQHRRR